MLLRPTEQDLFELARQLQERRGKRAKDAAQPVDLLVYGVDDFKAVEATANSATSRLETASSYLIIEDSDQKNRVLAELLSDPAMVADFKRRLGSR